MNPSELILLLLITHDSKAPKVLKHYTSRVMFMYGSILSLHNKVNQVIVPATSLRALSELLSL